MVDISYLATPAEAERRLKMMNDYSSVGPGSKTNEVGEEAYVLLYGRQARIRFRLHHVSVQIHSLPDFRSKKGDEVSRDKRETLVRRVAKMVETVILGYEKP